MLKQNIYEESDELNKIKQEKLLLLKNENVIIPALVKSEVEKEIEKVLGENYCWKTCKNNSID